MDNNTNNQNNMPFVQPGQPEMQPGVQPQPGQPQYGQPQMQPGVQPQFGQPQMQPGVQPQYGQPQMQPGVQPQPGQSQFGQPEMRPGVQPQFGQPQMQPGQYPQYGQQPQQSGKAKKQKAPKVKKPMTGGKIAAIVSGSVALVAAIVCGVIFIPKLFKPAKDVVVDAFENTFATSADKETTYKEQLLGIDEINTMFMEEGGEQDMHFVLESIGYEELPYDIGLDINNRSDYVNNVINATISLIVEENGILTFEMLADEENSYFAVPNLIDGYFSLPNENFYEALQDSFIGQELELSGMPLTGIDYFASSETELNSEYIDAGETIWDSFTVEKEGKAKIDVNGETVKATEYVMTLAKEDLQDALSSAVDAVFTDEYINEYAESLGMSYEDVASTFETAKAVIPTLISDDLVIRVYIKDDKVVKLTSEGSTNIYGVSLGYDFYLDVDEDDIRSELVIDVMGEELTVDLAISGLEDSPKGALVIEVADEKIGVDFSYAEYADNGKNTNYFDATISYNSDDIVEIAYSMITDTSDNTYEGSIVVGLDEYTMNQIGVDLWNIELLFEGSYTDINKGVSYTDVIDSCILNVNGEQILELSGKYTITAGWTSTQDPASLDIVYDLATLTEDEFMAIVEENNALIEMWMDDIINNTGSFGEEIGELIFGSYVDDEDYDDYYYPEDPDYTMEDAVLEGYDYDVIINNTLQGFALSYVSSFYIEFETEELSDLTYYLFEDYTVNDVLDLAYMPDEDMGYTIYDTKENQELVLSDGTTVYYSYVQYESFGYAKSFYTMAKEVAPGVILNIDVDIYDEDDFYTLEEIAEVLNDDNFTLVSE